MRRRIVLAFSAVGVIIASAAAAQLGYDQLWGNQAGESATLSAPASTNGGALSINSILVVWSGPADGEDIDRYEIIRDGVPIATTNLLSFTDLGLQPATTYRYSVRAGSDDRWSDLSDAVGLTTDPEAR